MKYQKNIKIIKIIKIIKNSMPKLIDIIREDGGLRCMPTLRRTLDEDTSFDTDDNKNKNNYEIKKYIFKFSFNFSWIN